MPECFSDLCKFFPRKNPDSAVLRPGYGPIGARSAPYENLRVLRITIV